MQKVTIVITANEEDPDLVDVHTEFDPPLQKSMVEVCPVLNCAMVMLQAATESQTFEED